MLPGYVAGLYSHDQCHIDLATLATFAKARLVHDTCVSIDPHNNQIGFRDRPPLKYDCLSIDIGITPDLQSTSGMENVTPVKPIDGCACLVLAVTSHAEDATVTGRAARDITPVFHHNCGLSRSAMYVKVRVESGGIVSAPWYTCLRTSCSSQQQPG